MGSAIKTRLLGGQSDERLLALACAGSQSAFEALALRYRRPLLRRCRQLCLLEDAAQEVLRLTLAQAWSDIGGEAEVEDVRSWLHSTAQRIAVESTARGGDAATGAAPRPEEVLALRGALAAMTPVRKQSVTIGQETSSEKSEVLHENGLRLADGPVSGLLRGVRRGISAITPPPLLAWAIGRATEGSGSDRIAELGAGGGAGLAGLAVKGGIAAITAGVAITGAAIVHGAHAPSSSDRDRAAALPSAGPVDSHARSAPDSTDGAVNGSRLRAGTNAPRGRGDAKRFARGRASLSLSPSLRRTVAQAPGNGFGQPSERSTSSAAGATSPTAPSDQPATAPQPGSEGSSPTAGGGSTTTSSGQTGSSTGTSGQSSGGGTGIGVQVSVESGSGEPSSGTGGGSGGSSPAGSSGQESKSSGPGVGISVSLEPVGSVGVHVSLP